ncbi:ATP-dependent zinc metalloprotease FtsH [Trueperella sp. LYQ143]|uniref:ATP-dependent zinc metalloprotease FtsH n=1 Tax=unclassified Trueperella TaxID=2630174 RepID=UPI003982DCF6
MSDQKRRILEEFNRKGRRNHRKNQGDRMKPDTQQRPDQKDSELWGVTRRDAQSERKLGGGDSDSTPPKKLRVKIGYLLALAVAVAVGVFLFLRPEGFTDVKTSEGFTILQKQAIEHIEVTDGSQIVRIWLEKDYRPTSLEGDELDPTDQVQFQYLDSQADYVAKLVSQAKTKDGYNSIVPQESIVWSVMSLLLPIILIVAAFLWLLPRIQDSMSQFGKIKRNGFESAVSHVTFDDVAGADEAVEELREIKEFIENPKKFYAMGAKIPKGVLLYGPPGTGKTLLARAVAGEAGVPFFHISASEFVEMFVGVGASRVRDLFAKAKKVAPAIIFVDEIDAVGRNRGIGIGGGNDEREQTLNQLLVEMDGFDEHSNVIVIAATNRPDVLDSALLRPGRFDRQIGVDAPDLTGRERILQVHADGKPLAEEVSLSSIARRTPGFSGADLANLLNEAALLAARRGHPAIGETDVDEAIDRLIAGPQRRTRVMNAKEKQMTAYHEAGHAVAAAALNHTDPVTKVTILPRGRALGYTMVMPTEDRYSTSRNQLLDQLVYAMGGRTAEEIVFHDPSTGAANDIQKATNIARKMVTEYGMSDRVGPVRLTPDEADPMSGMGGGGARDHSDSLACTVDEEVRQLMDVAAQEAWQIMMDNRHVLDRLTSELLEHETVLEDRLREIFSDIVKAPSRELWLSSPNRPVSTDPPVPFPQEQQ